MRTASGGVFVLVLALGVAGCDPQTTTTPTQPTPSPPVTESFAGSVTVNGAATFSFVSLSSGYVQATLKTLSPELESRIGLALGTWNGVTCQMILTNDDAGQNVTVTGSVAAAAALCVRIYDVGQLTQTNAFEITVIHP
jgi:hypothetical protein